MMTANGVPIAGRTAEEHKWEIAAFFAIPNFGIGNFFSKIGSFLRLEVELLKKRQLLDAHSKVQLLSEEAYQAPSLKRTSWRGWVVRDPLMWLAESLMAHMGLIMLFDMKPNLADIAENMRILGVSFRNLNRI